MVNHCFELVNNGEICSVTPGVDRPRCEKRRRYTVGSNTCWLVVLTILKNIRQWEGLSHILWKLKNVPNHQSVIDVWWIWMFVDV